MTLKSSFKGCQFCMDLPVLFEQAKKNGLLTVFSLTHTNSLSLRFGAMSVVFLTLRKVRLVKFVFIFQLIRPVQIICYFQPSCYCSFNDGIAGMTIFLLRLRKHKHGHLIILTCVCCRVTFFLRYAPPNIPNSSTVNADPLGSFHCRNASLDSNCETSPKCFGTWTS